MSNAYPPTSTANVVVGAGDTQPQPDTLLRGYADTMQRAADTLRYIGNEYRAMSAEIDRLRTVEQLYLDATDQDVMDCGHVAEWKARDGYEGYCVMCTMTNLRAENARLRRLLASAGVEA